MVGVLSNKISRDDLKPGDHIYSWRHSYLYAHHAIFTIFYLDSGIYVGNGTVIHFTPGTGQEIGTGTVFDRFVFSSIPGPNLSDSPCSGCGDRPRTDGVISSCLECFLWNGDLYLFQYGVSRAMLLAKRGGTCTNALSDPPEDVIHRAEYLLHNGFGGYNLFNKNCEDFAIYCKTGLLLITKFGVEGQSGQVTSIVAAATSIVSLPLRYLRGGIVGLTAGCSIYCMSKIMSDIGVRRDAIKIPVEKLVLLFVSDEPEAETNTSKEE